jgi:hypothetical protein
MISTLRGSGFTAATRQYHELAAQRRVLKTFIRLAKQAARF